MSKYMLVDASHPEETRVAVVEDGRVQDYDFVTTTKKQIKGNFYLAKITRIEPSLQAAFVEYGEDRQGFLPFAEIHPDYYQIPVSDKEELRRQASTSQGDSSRAHEVAIDPNEDGHAEGDEAGEEERRDEALAQAQADDPDIETVIDDDDVSALVNPLDFYKKYKIQEVMKRGQIILVQVLKEERGNKGAVLTSYITLAGRYCVLMPNTLSTGGISRKISNSKDRKELRSIVDGLEVEDGMSVIIRTAGSGRTKAEIKRDFEYLKRLWNQIRESTLSSTAPNLIYEESDLVKRSIRDLYNTTYEAVHVQGDEVYKSAKAFMKTLMPSHAARVKQYRGDVPIFYSFGIEDQLLSMNNPVAQLRSGGYLVINPTEALVSIDVNSGRSTKEHSIEETAVNTNIEAANEVARQLRLRDLAGLLVIDFIDMMDSKNRRAVEHALKEALRNDRAKIQVGRISPFGLLEMSRQRLRPSINEVNAQPCPHCSGSGIARSTESYAIQILRTLERDAVDESCKELIVTTWSDIALYVLNTKREQLREIESKYDLNIQILIDDNIQPRGFSIESVDDSGKHATISSVEMEKVGYTAADSNAGRKRSSRRKRGRKREGWSDEDNNSQKTTSASTSQRGHSREREVAESDESQGNQVEVLENTDNADGAQQPREEGRRRRRRGPRNRRRGGANRDVAENAVSFDDDSAVAEKGNHADERSSVSEPVTGAEAIPLKDVNVGVVEEVKPKARVRRGVGSRRPARANKDTSVVDGDTKGEVVAAVVDSDGLTKATPEATVPVSSEDVVVKKARSPRVSRGRAPVKKETEDVVVAERKESSVATSNDNQTSATEASEEVKSARPVSRKKGWWGKIMES